MRALIVTLALVGCSPSGSVAVEGEPADTSGDTNDSSGDTNDTIGDTNDTNGDTEEKEEEEVNPYEAYADTYEGDLWLLLKSEWFDYELEDCEAIAEVTDEGELFGDGACRYESGWGANGWGGGGDGEIPLMITGEVSEDGEVTGMIEVQLDWDYFELEPMEMDGEIDGDELVFDFDGEVVTDWTDAEVIGEGELRR